MTALTVVTAGTPVAGTGAAIAGLEAAIAASFVATFLEVTFLADFFALVEDFPLTDALDGFLAGEAADLFATAFLVVVCFTVAFLGAVFFAALFLDVAFLDALSAMVCGLVAAIGL